MTEQALPHPADVAFWEQRRAIALTLGALIVPPLDAKTLAIRAVFKPPRRSV